MAGNKRELEHSAEDDDRVLGTYYLRGMRLDIRTDARRWVGGRPQQQIDLLLNGMQFWVASVVGSPLAYQVLCNQAGRALREYDEEGNYPEVTPETARELRRRLYDALKQEFSLDDEDGSGHNSGDGKQIS